MCRCSASLIVRADIGDLPREQPLEKLVLDQQHRLLARRELPGGRRLPRGHLSAEENQRSLSL